MKVKGSKGKAKSKKSTTRLKTVKGKNFTGAKKFKISKEKLKELLAQKGKEGKGKANKGVSEATPMSWNEFQAANRKKYNNVQMSEEWGKYKKDNYPNQGEHYLNRPYIRQSTIDGVNANTRFNKKGQAWDPNAEKWVEGKPDLGHKKGNEFWYERDQAEAKGWTQQQFNDHMNNPNNYQWEDASSNRSHQHEDKHK